MSFEQRLPITCCLACKWKPDNEQLLDLSLLPDLVLAHMLCGVCSSSDSSVLVTVAAWGGVEGAMGYPPSLGLVLRSGPRACCLLGLWISEVSGRLASAFSCSGTLSSANEVIHVKALYWHKWRDYYFYYFRVWSGWREEHKSEVLGLNRESSHCRSLLFWMHFF